MFGYGSLVSSASMASTIGRSVTAGDVLVAQLDGYERRWNYGSQHQRGDWHHGGVSVSRGVVVALGLAVVGDASCNGVIVRVSDDELALLDRRERDYDRTDVTDKIRVDHGSPDGRIVTYVPRAAAVERYEAARDRGRAAVARSYWGLVADAFAALGAQHLERYATTPAPDVPVVDMSLLR